MTSLIKKFLKEELKEKLKEIRIQKKKEKRKFECLAFTDKGSVTDLNHIIICMKFVTILNNYVLQLLHLVQFCS